MFDDRLIQNIASDLHEAKVFKAKTGIYTESIVVMNALEKLHDGISSELGLSWYRIGVAYRSNFIVYDRYENRMKANMSTWHKSLNIAAIAVLSIGCISTAIFLLIVLFLQFSGHASLGQILFGCIVLILGIYELILRLISESVIDKIIN